MLDKDVVLTQEGLRKLEAELEYLRTVRRKEVTGRIRESLEFGDPWENPEYESAKNEQAFVEGRILTLENMLRNARVINSKETRRDVVSLGSSVKLRDMETADEFECVIVGSAEADPFQHKISYKAPVAKAILGHKVGDRVKVEAPAGPIEYEILTIQTAPSAAN